MTTRTAIDPDPKGSFNVGGGDLVPMVLKYIVVFRLCLEMPSMLYVAAIKHGIMAMVLLAGWVALLGWATIMLLTTTKEK